jgi:thiamine kinase-like enzyme
MDIPNSISTEIAKTLGLHPNDLAIKMRPPLDFQSNRLYDIWADGRHLIAKEYLQPDELEIAPWREYQALQVLAPLDIAPQPVFYEPTLGPIVVYAYMEGEMWDRRSATPSDLANLAETWLKLNTAQADWFSRGSERSLHTVILEFRQRIEAYWDWTKTEFKPGERAAEMCLELLEKRQNIISELAESQPVTCFCRADPRFANVIQRPNGQLGLVDWEDSGLRDPARDAADLVTHPNQEDLIPWPTWQAFLTPYQQAHSKTDPDFPNRVHSYLALFPIFWLSVILMRGVKLAASNQLANWTVNEIPVNQRLGRYLVRARAWPEMAYEHWLENTELPCFFPTSETRKT